MCYMHLPEFTVNKVPWVQVWCEPRQKYNIVSPHFSQDFPSFDCWDSKDPELGIATDQWCGCEVFRAQEKYFSSPKPGSTFFTVFSLLRLLRPGTQNSQNLTPWGIIFLEYQSQRKLFQADAMLLEFLLLCLAIVSLFFFFSKRWVSINEYLPIRNSSILYNPCLWNILALLQWGQLGWFVVRFPDWHKCHFQSGWGNLTW